MKFELLSFSPLCLLSATEYARPFCSSASQYWYSTWTVFFSLFFVDEVSANGVCF